MKKGLVFLLSILMVMCYMGCASKQVEPDNIIVLNNFESQEDLDSLRMFGILGKVELTNDSKYVTAGISSAKVTVVSDPYKESVPFLYQATDIVQKEINYTDFSEVDGILLDVYNAQPNNNAISFRLVYNNQGNTTLKNRTSTKTYFELAPEQWTDIYYPIKRDCIPIVENKAQVIGIEIGFERSETNQIYFLDNLRLKTTMLSYSPLQMQLDTNEICSFDNTWQIEKIVCSNGGLDLLEGNISLEKQITSNGAGASLRIEAPQGYGSYVTTDRYPGITLEREMTKLFPWEQYKDTDRLCFDVFSPAENGIGSLFFSMYADSQRYFNARIETIPGEWLTVSFSVAQLNENIGVTGGFSKTEQLFIRWGENIIGDRVFYLDNIRMEVNDA